MYTIAAEDLASRGYVVISMDHTGEALATVFPNGRVVTSQITDPYAADTQKKALDTRVEDASFVVDTVESLSRGDDPDGIGGLLPDGLPGAVDPDRIGMFGHSIGGATTTQVLLDDPRVDAGVNVDGALLYANTASPIVSQDPGTPLLSVLNSRHAESPKVGTGSGGDDYSNPPASRFQPRHGSPPGGGRHDQRPRGRDVRPLPEGGSGTRTRRRRVAVPAGLRGALAGRDAPAAPGFAGERAIPRLLEPGGLGFHALQEHRQFLAAAFTVRSEIVTLEHVPLPEHR